MLRGTAPKARTAEARTRINTGPHSFHEVCWNDGKGTVYGFAFADFNGGDWPDIVAARSDAPNAIWFSTEPMPS
jgi:hypothetical protein